jgi:hypothetical protein
MGIKEACMHARAVTHLGFVRGFPLPAQVDWDEQRIRKIEEKKPSLLQRFASLQEVNEEVRLSPLLVSPSTVGEGGRQCQVNHVVRVEKQSQETFVFFRT